MRLLLLTLVLWLGPTVAGSWAVAPSRSFEYLYVESNSGDASGGHVAICFDAQCYHFQQDEAQTIRLHRDTAAEFDYHYRLLGNRTIHAMRVQISTPTYDRLRGAFQERLQIQDRQVDVLRSLASDRALLEEIDRHHGEAPGLGVEVPGSAYFVADEGAAAVRRWPGTERAAVLERLAERVGAAYGSDYIERRTAALQAAIGALRPEVETEALPQAGRLPSGPAGFATRHRDLLSGWLALAVLRAAPALRAGTYHTAADSDFVLTPAEIEVLRVRAERQAGALLGLLASQRPDWGYPLMVGMARLLALQASIDSGSLVVLDDFSTQAPTVTGEVVARHAAVLRQMRDERRADFRAARRAFFAAPSDDETSLSGLEVTANLVVDIDRALAQQVPLRVYTGGLVPARSASRWDWPLPAVPQAAVAGAVATARAREDAYRAALVRLYPYDLFSHNCVTEIFRTMDTALASAANPAADPDHAGVASAAALGGHVEWRGTLNFIPFVSARAVEQAYRVTERVERPSYRRIALADMKRRESRWRVELRESNVLTARSYSYNHDDPLFLFFTDNVVWRRPLYGVANLVVGIGGVLTGVALLPVDGGSTLRAGLSGVLFSVPEIAFVNIRKGSLAYAPRSWLSDGATPGLSVGQPARGADASTTACPADRQVVEQCGS